MSDLMGKARELGRAMTNTEAYGKLSQAEQQLNEDPEAQALLEGLQQAQDKMQRLQASGLQPTEEQMEEVQNARSEMDDNPAVAAFLEAQSEFGELVKEVNAEISEGMKQEDGEDLET